MESITALPVPIQYVVRKLADPTITFEQLGRERGVTRQAAEKQYKKALRYLKAYTGRDPSATVVSSFSEPACKECKGQVALVAQLRRQLIVSSVHLRILNLFREKVLKFFPRMKSATERLPAADKKYVLDALDKFTRTGGLIKEFAVAISRSPETLARWKDAYKKYGMSGLVDKITRPKHFGHKIPLRIKALLVTLFMQYPNWTPYQYHSHIRHSPTSNWYVSLPVIIKLKNMHTQATAAEKERIKKRWCFAPGTSAWTVDFTCILKTDKFKLQCLTISDQRSRFLIHTALYLNTSTELVMGEFEQLFLKFGKPDMVKADNGPEFKLELREHLRDLSVYLINNPKYYGQFGGAHERIHRTMKAFIAPFNSHHNLMRLVEEIKKFQDEYNYTMKSDYLEGKTPADIFFGDGLFTPKNSEVVTPYEKDGELRMKFADRNGDQARIAVAIIESAAVSKTVDSETPTAVAENTLKTAGCADSKVVL